MQPEVWRLRLRITPKVARQTHRVKNVTLGAKGDYPLRPTAWQLIPPTYTRNKIQRKAAKPLGRKARCGNTLCVLAP